MKQPLYLPSLRKQQGGYAAFVVSMIIMIVLALIVLGFASNARAEQTRALNDQLSTEAYYAAESGINDAYTIITNELASGGNIVAQTKSCTTSNDLTDPDAYTTSSSSELPAPLHNVSYSCLLVNPTPQSLDYQPMLVGQGQTVPVFGQTSGGADTPVGYIAISWQEHNIANTDFTGCPTAGTFKPQSTYGPDCTAGVLQVDIVGANNGMFTDPDSLISNDTASVFLEPASNGGTAPVTVAAGSQVVGVKCGATSGYAYACTALLNVGNLSSSTGQYYLHVVPFYYDEDVSIVPENASQNQLNTYDAQVLIDSTGDADGSLKRLQERVCINEVCNNQAPANALESTSGLCKQFYARPGYESAPYGTC